MKMPVILAHFNFIFNFHILVHIYTNLGTHAKFHQGYVIKVGL
jgi:hypothetical protein